MRFVKIGTLLSLSVVLCFTALHVTSVQATEAGFAPAKLKVGQNPAPDNTKKNKMGGTTADHQKNNKADRMITQNIRKSIMADKSLSTYAKNVKVITKDGAVTLRGPVRTAEEKSSVEMKATEVAGAGHVTNEIEVAPKKRK